MTDLYLSPGDLDARQVGERWILVLGGVTRQGNRTARRTSAQALEAGIDVVWFDGFAERYPNSDERVPLDVEAPIGRLIVVEFHEAEARSLPGRVRANKKMQANVVTRLIWRFVLRRLGSILRPRACWHVIRPDVESLFAGSAPPETIVYSDDTSITSAWHAARLWPDARVSTTVLIGAE